MGRNSRTERFIRLVAFVTTLVKNSIAFAMTRTSTILFLTLLTPLFFIFVTSTISNIIDLLYPSANKDDS